MHAGSELSGLPLSVTYRSRATDTDLSAQIFAEQCAMVWMHTGGLEAVSQEGECTVCKWGKMPFLWSAVLEGSFWACISYHQSEDYLSESCQKAASAKGQRDGLFWPADMCMHILLISPLEWRSSLWDHFWGSSLSFRWHLLAFKPVLWARLEGALRAEVCGSFRLSHHVANSLNCWLEKLKLHRVIQQLSALLSWCVSCESYAKSLSPLLMERYEGGEREEFRKLL